MSEIFRVGIGLNEERTITDGSRHLQLYCKLLSDLGITEQCAVRMCDGFMVKERGRREEWSGTIMIDVNQWSLS